VTIPQFMAISFVNLVRETGRPGMQVTQLACSRLRGGSKLTFLIDVSAYGHA
jgi:hypothetical protein